MNVKPVGLMWSCAILLSLVLILKLLDLVHNWTRMPFSGRRTEFKIGPQ
jgi:hypothetical protein